MTIIGIAKMNSLNRQAYISDVNVESDFTKSTSTTNSRQGTGGQSQARIATRPSGRLRVTYSGQNSLTEMYP